MKDIFIIKSLYMFAVLWGISLLLLWVRPRIEIFWKIIGTLIFSFYIWFFFDEISKGILGFISDWYTLSIKFLKEIISLLFVNLFFLWPVCLVIIFYKSDDIGAEKLLKFMCVLTLILWIVFVVYFYFNTGIDEFFYDKLKKMIPYAK